MNIEHSLVPAEHKRIWKHISRVLKKRGVVALWVREPSPASHVNYHLLVASEHSERELKDSIDASLPKGINYHKQVKAIVKQWAYPRYITKAKVKGYVDGKFRLDKYQDKRLLFRKKVGLQKQGTIGSFWVRPVGDLWSVIVAREKRIAEGLASPGVREAVEYWHSEVFQGEVSRRQIERSFGFHRTADATLYSYSQIGTRTI